MSWHFLQEGAEVSWAGSSLDGEPDALLKLIPTPGASCWPDSATDACLDSQSGTTFGHSTVSRGEDTLMSSREVSRARTSASPEKAPALTEREADCGKSLPESFARWDPNSSSWKTHQRSLLGDWEPFLETWPRWGMMRDGECWGLSTPWRRIKENEYGYWPTPVKTDGFAVGWCKTSIERKERGETRPSGAHIGSGLKYFRKTGQYLSNGYPNPMLTEWLMGWPINWTDLQPLATDRFQQWLNSHGRF